MDVHKFLELLYGLYAEQEQIVIEYQIDDLFFSTESFK